METTGVTVPGCPIKDLLSYPDIWSIIKNGDLRSVNLPRLKS